MRNRTLIYLAGCAAAFLAAATPAAAEPLRNVVEPLCSSLDVDFANGTPDMSGKCEAPGSNSRRDRLEISLTAARGPAQIGDFAIIDAFLYNGSYTPEVWRVDPGDRIQIALDNQLSGPVGFRTNLHTHGFIVSPNNAAGTPETPIGDNVFALIYAEDATDEQREMHMPENGVPIRSFDKTAQYLVELPDDHPLGLYWYHPHPHGISGPQVIGGMSGVLAVGKASDYVARDVGQTAIPGPVEEKILMLKDTQVTRQAGETQWHINADYDSGNCQNPAMKKPGVCYQDANNAWLFPVNGQIYPTIQIAEGIGQLWRIANIGANTTYQLQLVEITDDGTEIPLPFQVISVDGVAVGRSPGDAPILREKLLVMPSARIEVLVSHPGTEGKARNAVFQTVGFSTGATPDVGDNWPAIDLAEVVFDNSLPRSSEHSGLAFVDDGGNALDFSPKAAASGNAECRRLSGDQVRIVAFDVPDFTDAKKARAGFTPPPGCKVDQEYGIIGSVVTTVSDESSFAAILAAYDDALAGKYSGPFDGDEQAYRGKCFDGALDTCVPYPSVETWWVVNASNEAHNFHIHQTRFQVLEVRGAESNFTPIPEARHDNYPVLAGQAIKVRIALNRPEQIGYFVYHCHILEHEDLGMMAAIEVREVE